MPPVIGTMAYVKQITVELKVIQSTNQSCLLCPAQRLVVALWGLLPSLRLSSAQLV